MRTAPNPCIAASAWQLPHSPLPAYLPTWQPPNHQTHHLLPPACLPARPQVASSDPTLPLGAAICYCAYKLYEKRQRRMGTTDTDRTPIWGALGSTLLALVLGGVLSMGLVAVVPLPPRVSGEAAGALLIALSLGFAAIYLK